MQVKGFRKQLLLPAEHGTWSWLIVPYFVGLGIAGSFNLGALLVFVGSMSIFLTRQPATVWLRVRRGRGRKRDGPIAARVLLGLCLLGLVCLLGLLALGLQDIFWLTLPMAGLIVVYLSAALSQRTRTRTLWMEMAGAAGLALTAPAAMITVQEEVTTTVWFIWILVALQNVLGALYVRLRLADTHGRLVDRWPLLLIHALVFLGVVGTAVFDYVPLLTTVPFLGFLLRALWTYPQPRPIPNIKKFGFTEIGVEIAGGLVFVLAYAVW
ncbi:MAG: hypothetical protein GY796_09800 [Chloroflexi bacterium]|nr:hypothetical protein [Chloroflexota bacterium]